MLDTLPSPPSTQPHLSLLLLQPPTCPDQGTLMLAKQMEQFSPFSPPLFSFVIVAMRNFSKEALCYKKSAWQSRN